MPATDITIANLYRNIKYVSFFLIVQLFDRYYQNFRYFLDFHCFLFTGSSSFAFPETEIGFSSHFFSSNAGLSLVASSFIVVVFSELL